MKRTLASALIVGATACFGLAGCGEESKVTSTDTVSTPEGTKKVTTETKVETSGNPPATPDAVAPK